jgi:hypothetical protein
MLNSYSIRILEYCQRIRIMSEMNLKQKKIYKFLLYTNDI